MRTFILIYACFLLVILSTPFVFSIRESIINANAEPVAIIRQASDVQGSGKDDIKIDYYITDFQGNVRNLVSENQILLLQDYQPFGSEVPYVVVEQEEGYFKFKGMLFDSITKDYLVGGIFYDPELGRYLVGSSSQDLFKPELMNPYVGFANNPFRSINSETLLPDLGIPEAPDVLHAKAKVAPPHVTAALASLKPDTYQTKFYYFYTPEKIPPDPHVTFGIKNPVEYLIPEDLDFVFRPSGVITTAGSSPVDGIKNWVGSDGLAMALYMNWYRRDNVNKLGLQQIDSLEHFAGSKPLVSGEKNLMALVQTGDVVRFYIDQDGKPFYVKELHMSRRGGLYKITRNPGMGLQLNNIQEIAPSFWRSYEKTTSQRWILEIITTPAVPDSTMGITSLGTDVGSTFTEDMDNIPGNK